MYKISFLLFLTFVPFCKGISSQETKYLYRHFCQKESNANLLYVAVDEGDLVGVNILLSDSNINVHYVDKDGDTLLHIAALRCTDGGSDKEQKYLPIIILLLQRGVDPTIKNKKGLTAAESAEILYKRGMICYEKTRRFLSVKKRQKVLSATPEYPIETVRALRNAEKSYKQGIK